jgi:outer membrane protein assembly factor BamA
LKSKSNEEHPRKRKFVEHWVHKNSIKFKKQQYNLGEDAENLSYDLESTILQQPDQSIIRGFRRWVFHTTDSMSVKYVFDKKEQQYIADTIYRKQKGIKPWLHETVGSSPTILDTNLVQRTRQSMERLLHQKAYFDAKVDYDIVYKKHKALVTYNITTGMPLLIDSVQFYSKDTVIAELLNQIKPTTLLVPRAAISAELVAAEKKRITVAVRNQGYFDFTWKYIIVQADTVNARKVKKGLTIEEQGEPRANIYMEVLPYSDTSIVHPQYKVNNVYITPNEYILKPHQKRVIRKDSFFIVERVYKERWRNRWVKNSSELLPTDSLLFTKEFSGGTWYRIRRKVERFKKLTLQSLSEMEENDRWVHTILRKKYTKEKDFFIRDKIISDALAIKAGDYYNYDATQESVKKVNNLTVFRFPRIEYVPASNGDPYSLDCIVKMQPSKKQSLGGELEFNINSANVFSVGGAASVVYRNKNIFKGAEVFEISLSGGADFRVAQDSTVTSTENGTWLDQANLIDVSIETSLYFPRFLGINAIERFLKMENIRTKASLGFRYLKQSTDFAISSFDGKVGYLWSKGSAHQFSWNPVLVNFTLAPELDPLFRQLLAKNNIALLNSLQQQFLIPSMDFTHAYSPKRKGGGKLNINTSLEVAGNALYLLDLVIEPNKPLTIFGVDYSQYFRAEVDIQYSYEIDRKNEIATRLSLGMIVPWGNSLTRDIPFVKRFTLGGPSSMRAWNLRYLGPGTQVAIEGAEFQVGDIKTEFNIEYRRMLNSWIEAAVFVDIGNIWTLYDGNPIPTLPNQNPRTSVFTEKFYQQLAVGGGVGIRFDFSFFVFRIDLAVQLRDPQGYGLRSDGSIQYWNWDKFIFPERHRFVFAIGYPF